MAKNVNINKNCGTILANQKMTHFKAVSALLPPLEYKYILTSEKVDLIKNRPVIKGYRGRLLIKNRLIQFN